MERRVRSERRSRREDESVARGADETHRDPRGLRRLPRRAYECRGRWRQRVIIGWGLGDWLVMFDTLLPIPDAEYTVFYPIVLKLVLRG